MINQNMEPSTLVELPLLTLRDVAIYPQMVISLFVGREKSIQALERAMSINKKIFLLAQKDSSEDNPTQEQLFTVGTVATVLQLLQLPDGTIKIMIEGNYRASLVSLIDNRPCCYAQITPISEHPIDSKQETMLCHSLMEALEQYTYSSKKISSEVIDSLKKITHLDRLINSAAVHFTFTLEEKQHLLTIVTPQNRLEYFLGLIDKEVDFLKTEQRIRQRVKKQMEKSQREYYLNEQVKAIHKELSSADEQLDEYTQLSAKIEASGMPKDAYKKATGELKKLQMMPSMSAEATVVRNYIDWLIDTPWKKRSKLRYNLQAAHEILEADHYGLKEVKDCVLEHLAVQQRTRKVKGLVLCLVGPPGVGKTSLGKSIAKATHRQYVRMALGGVRDESEIRGHRRTYIGAMPGKLIQQLAKSGVKNPLFLLDEIDKLGSDMRGDPTSALLEVLDPAQNQNFNDHYLEVDYDLSDVMFVCTANTMNIPSPLLDRMEIIRIPGYTEEEKLNIAKRYLVPKQKKRNGLKPNELVFDDESILSLIRYYTREAGVRDLERQIAKIARKIVKEQALSHQSHNVTLDATQLEHYCGVRQYDYGLAGKRNQIGQVTGLAWTQFGGELLTIEAVGIPGKGNTVIKTGSLGDVMQESIQAALTVVKSRSEALGIEYNFNETLDLHIHVPEGATPKDGPSAGIGMCTAMVSVLTNTPVRCQVAMTGEITLRGQILAIGGLKEKLLAAHRGGITTVIIPKDNMKDLKEVPDNIKEKLVIKPVQWIDEALSIALEYEPTLRLTNEHADAHNPIEKTVKSETKKPIKTH